MQHLIESLWLEQQFTALLITHDVEEAVVLADRVLLVENGRIAMNVPISLPRPRARGNAVFVQTVERILRHVMGKQEKDHEVRGDQPLALSSVNGLTSPLSFPDRVRE